MDAYDWNELSPVYDGLIWIWITNHCLFFDNENSCCRIFFIICSYNQAHVISHVSSRRSVGYYFDCTDWLTCWLFLAHSKHELIQWRGIRRLSVCLSVNFCANRFFSQANGRIATKFSQDGLQVSVHPGCAQGQRSHDTGTFVLAGKSLLLPCKWPDQGVKFAI